MLKSLFLIIVSFFFFVSCGEDNPVQTVEEDKIGVLVPENKNEYVYQLTSLLGSVTILFMEDIDIEKMKIDAEKMPYITEKIYYNYDFNNYKELQYFNSKDSEINKMKIREYLYIDTLIIKSKTISVKLEITKDIDKNKIIALSLSKNIIKPVLTPEDEKNYFLNSTLGYSLQIY